MEKNFPFNIKANCLMPCFLHTKKGKKLVIFLKISRLSQQAGVNYYSYFSELILKINKAFSSKGTMEHKLIIEHS